MTCIVYCNCSGQFNKGTISEEEASEQQQQLVRQHHWPFTLPSVADKLSSLHVQDGVPRGPAPISTTEHMPDAHQHGSSGIDSACQQQSQDANLLPKIALTQCYRQEKGCRPNGHAELAGRQQHQALQLPQDVHDLHTARISEDNTHFSSSLVDCGMADAALPVSQALPDTAMELWDSGNDEQREHDHDAAGLEANSKAAEALQELEEFCKSVSLAAFPKFLHSV